MFGAVGFTVYVIVLIALAAIAIGRGLKIARYEDAFVKIYGLTQNTGDYFRPWDPNDPRMKFVREIIEEAMD